MGDDTETSDDPIGRREQVEALADGAQREIRAVGAEQGERSSHEPSLAPRR